MSAGNNNNQGGPMSPMMSPGTPDNSMTGGGTTIMRIEQDSDDNLQALFDSVLKPGEKKILSIPLSMRKLPKSFFQPPSHSRENSIDSALGSTTPTPTSGGSGPPAGATSAASPQQQQQHLGLTNHRLTISHSRAHSSPATLQQTYAAGQKLVQQQQQAAAAQAAASAANGGSAGGGGATAGPQAANSASSASAMGTPLKAVHASQRSYDVVSAIQLQEELGDLPPGWEQARTAEGQIYYLK